MRCQRPTPEGSRSMGERGLGSGEPDGGGRGGARGTQLMLLHQPKRRATGPRRALASRRLSPRPAVFPAQPDAAHSTLRCRHLLSTQTESRCPGHPADRDQASRPRVSLRLHLQTSMPERQTVGHAQQAGNWPRRMLQQRRVWNPALDAQGPRPGGRTHVPGQLPISQPQRSRCLTGAAVFPSVKGGQ